MKLKEAIQVLHPYERARLLHILKTEGDRAVVDKVYENYGIYYNALRRGLGGIGKAKRKHPMRREFLETILEYRWLLRSLGLHFNLGIHV